MRQHSLHLEGHNLDGKGILGAKNFWGEGVGQLLSVPPFVVRRLRHAPALHQNYSRSDCVSSL